MAGTEAIRASITASNDYHPFAGRENLCFRFDRFAQTTPILLR